MDLLRKLLNVNESSPDVPGFSIDKMSDQELIDMCRQMGIEDVCVIDGEGGLANRDEVVAELNSADADFHNDELPDTEYDGDHMTDAEADADALRNIGWGTDEDYGYYGECVAGDTVVVTKDVGDKSRTPWFRKGEKYVVTKAGKDSLRVKTLDGEKVGVSLPVSHVKLTEAKQYTKYTNLRKKFDYYKPVKMKKVVKEGHAEGMHHDAKVIRARSGKAIGELYRKPNGTWGNLHYGLDYGHDGFNSMQEAYDDLRAIHKEWHDRKRHSVRSMRAPALAMAESAKTVSFKNPYTKLVKPSHGGKQGDVKNKSFKDAHKDETGNAGLKGMKKKDRPYMEKPRFRDWLTANMVFNMTKSGELAGNMKLAEGTRTLTPEEQNAFMRWARQNGITPSQAVVDTAQNSIHWEGEHGHKGVAVHGEYDLNRNQSRWIDVKDENEKPRPQLHREPAAAV